MAKTPAEARHLLDTLSAKMRPLLDAELTRFRALLSESSSNEAVDEPNDGLLAVCDLAFLANLVEERFYAVDQKLLRQYFPLPHVLELMLGTYQVCNWYLEVFTYFFELKYCYLCTVYPLLLLTL